MGKKFITAILSLAVTITCCFSQTIVSEASMNITGFEALKGPTGAGAARISWDKNEDRVYKVYKSTDGVNYETVGVNFEEIEQVKVLHIYPDTYNGTVRCRDGVRLKDQIKSWVEDTSYGKGKIKVSSVDWNSFKANPNGYLKSNGEYKYDVIVFGIWDSNNGYAFNATMCQAVSDFVKAGRGCILTHDTIGYTGTASTTMGLMIDQYKFGELFGFSKYWPGTTRDSQSVIGGLSSSTRVIINKSGLFTTYPNYVGTVGDSLTIPYTHTMGLCVTDGTIWLRFSPDANGGEYHAGDNTHRAGFPNAKGYYDTPENALLWTKNNCAVICTGDSSGSASEDEKKIFANLIFYTVQLQSNSPVTDNSAMDYAAPNKPIISLIDENYDQSNFIVSATDNGTQYYYKVEEFNKSDTTKALASANTAGRITSGMAGYRYTVDTNPNTTITYNHTLANANISVTRTNNIQYLHVAAVDNAGNIGATNHYKIMAKDTKAPIISSITEYTNEVTAKDDDSNIANEYVTGIKGYCVTQTQTKPAANQFTAEPNFKVNRSGYNYVWAIDEAGNISKPYKIWIHSDLYYEGTEINRVFYNGVEVFEYNFEGNDIFF